MFYNLGALGNLVIFIALGESGVAILALFKVCEELIYFGWTFPFSRASSTSQADTNARKAFWKDPVFITALVAVIAGLVLNQSGISRPDVLSDLMALSVPLCSFLMIMAVGMTFNIQGGKQWVKLGVFVSIGRVLLGLLAVFLVISLFGLWSTNDGMVAKVCLVLAVMPTGFISTLPAALYHLDRSLANTCWLVSFIVSFITIPIAILMI